LLEGKPIGLPLGRPRQTGFVGAVEDFNILVVHLYQDNDVLRLPAFRLRDQNGRFNGVLRVKESCQCGVAIKNTPMTAPLSNNICKYLHAMPLQDPHPNKSKMSRPFR
jgi:hypothetical protein